MADESKTSLGAPTARLERVVAILKTRLEDTATVLDVLVTELGRGRAHPELWAMLHDAAARDDLLPELAFAYEQLARGRKLRATPPPVQAEVLLHAASFFIEIFGDREAATDFLERALVAVPDHPTAFAQLEQLLFATQSWLALAELYRRTADRREDPKEKIALLRRAAELIDRLPGEVERAITLYQQILEIDPGQRRFRRTLEARYLLAGRTRDAADFLERVLSGQPPPEDDEAFAMRTRLMVLYAGDLGEMERALPHVDELLARDPAHEQARVVARRLLEPPGPGVAPRPPAVSARAAAILAGVYERLGSAADAAAMLAIAMEHESGPDRTATQRRLAVLRQDALGDTAGALPLLEAVVSADPADEDARRRYRAVSAALGRRLDAARALARAAGVTNDASVRARIGTELGEMLAEAGDAKRARAVFQEVLDRGGDERAVLEAARQLVPLYAAAREQRPLALVLDLLCRIEPEPGARIAATERLARLLESELDDPKAAAEAWRRLLGTPKEQTALAALEPLYDRLGAQGDLAVVLERRASAASGPAARMLAFRAAALRASAAEQSGTLPAAVATWMSFLEAHGPARDVHANLVPLLERMERWSDLAAVLAQDAQLAPPDIRANLLGRVGDLWLRRLGDPAKALETFREALRLVADEPRSRMGLEQLLEQPEHQLLAAEILEPLYRSLGRVKDAVRALELRARRYPDAAARIAALEQAATSAERELADPARALSLAAEALAEAVAADSRRLNALLDRVEKLSGAATVAQRANLLAAALADRPVTSRGAHRLARAAGDALAAAGDVERALSALSRALAFEPSAEIQRQVDELALQRRSPEERLALLRASLTETTDPARRSELARAIAAVEAGELGDPDAATRTLEAQLEADRGDVASYEALAALAQARGDEPGQRAAFMRLAVARQEVLRDLPLAQAAFEKLVLAEPADAAARARHRAVCSELGRRADAIRVLSLARDQASDKSLRLELGVELGTLLIEAGEHRRARPLLVEGLGAEPQAPLTPTALGAARALCALYHKTRETKPLARMYELLARAEPEAVDRVAAMDRLVALVGDGPAGVAAWRAQIADAGPSREAYGRLATLLERAHALDELGDVLAADAELADGAERAALLERATALRLRSFGDPAAAFERLCATIERDPDDAEGRRLLRLLIASGPHRAAAADVLEPIARARDAAADLLLVLETRADLAADDDARLAALDEALTVAQQIGGRPERTLGLCLRALGEPLEPEAGRRWLARLDSVVLAVTPERRAELLLAALSTVAPADPRAARLAALAGDALEEIGNGDRATDLYLGALPRPLPRGRPWVELLGRAMARLMKRAEETLGSREAAVGHVAKHVLDATDDHVDATLAIGLMLPEIESIDGTLAALDALQRRSTGAVRTALDLLAAEVLLDRASRPEAAVDRLERVLDHDPSERAALPILMRAMEHGGVAQRGRALLERAADATKDPAAALAALDLIVASVEGGVAARRERIGELLTRYETRPDVALGLAVRAIGDGIVDDELCDRAERLAAALGRPQPVLEAYRRTLETPAGRPPVDRAAAARVGRRAVELYEEWFEDKDGALDLLRLLLPLDAAWAFDRIKLALIALARWNELYTLYDDAIERAESDARRARLLEEASQVAKDFASDPERAVAYLERLAALRPGDARIDGSLERLYERQGKNRDLIRLLSARLPTLAPGEAIDLRARIAALWLDVGDEGESLEQIEAIVRADPERPEPYALLERMVLLPESPSSATDEMPATRRRLALPAFRRAAFLLGERYAAAGRDAELVRVASALLETATNDEERVRHHGELVALRRKLGDERGALADLAALVGLEPSSAEHRRALAELAEALGAHAERAKVLVEAADAHAEDDSPARRTLRAALLREAAAVRRDKLGDPTGAVELYGRALVLARGTEAELETAREIEPLLAALGRDEERCSALETIATLETDRAARRAAFGRVARLAADVLHDDDRAIAALRARLGDDAADLEALDGLVTVLERGGRWDELGRALEARAAAGVDATAARRDRIEIARIELEQLGSVTRAIDAWRRVRTDFGPDDQNFSALAELLERENRWDELARLVAEEAGNAKDAARRVELCVRLGDVSRERLGDPDAAARAYGEALATDASEPRARAGLAALMAVATVRTAAASSFARSLVATGDWSAASRLAESLAADEDVEAELARRFWWGVAVHQRDVAGDADRAEWALSRALSQDPNSEEILTSLASIQRRATTASLVGTLVRLSEVRGGDLDLVREAAEVALGGLGDRALARENCERLLELAVSRWSPASRTGGKKKRAEPVDDDKSPRGQAGWALDQLVRMGLEDGDAPRVVALLQRGASLPFERDKTRLMRRDAARVTAERLGDVEAAISMYRALLDEDPSDAVARKAARELAQLLHLANRRAEVAALWEQQGTIAEAKAGAGGEDAAPARAEAAQLWGWAAELWEGELGDLAQALRDYRRGAALGGLDCWEALARIHSGRAEHAEAAEALEAICGLSAPADRSANVLRLAEAYLAAGDRATARTRLEQATTLVDDPYKVRMRLAALYREERLWDPLAALLTEEAARRPTAREELDLLREAATLHVLMRRDPGAAIPLLERAAHLAQYEPPLVLMLGEALIAIGRHADAIDVLAKQIERYGTRKPKDRALSHYSLARAARASGDRPRALAELDAAAKIDPTHAGILHAQARLAAELGHVDRAMRAYQALLLLRQTEDDVSTHQHAVGVDVGPDGPGDGDLARSEILLELADLAGRKGDAVRAAEFRESAFEAARESPEEEERLRIALERRGGS